MRGGTAELVSRDRILRRERGQGDIYFPCSADHEQDWRPYLVDLYSFGNLEGAVRRGRGGKEKEWTDCVQSDIRTFGIAGDWKATALNAEVWVETVTEGGRRFMAAWRKEEVDAARHRQEKREATRLGTLLSQTGV